MSLAYRLPNEGSILGVKITTFCVSDFPTWLTKEVSELCDADIPLLLRPYVYCALAGRDQAWEDYEYYLGTIHWDKVRNWKKAMARHRCEIDPDHIGALHVHHLRYDHLGCEPPEDLQVLCDNCHRAQHGLARLQIKESLSR